jgi:dihydrofolate reductase
MIISIIVAIAKNNVIGKGNELPWHLPADFEYFKKITAGCPVIMGAKTHFSIKKTLPNRKNIVLCDDPKVVLLPGAVMAGSFEEAFVMAREGKEAFIIGGANVYRQGLNFADRLYITEVQTEAEGDIFFPEFDKNEWREIKREKRAADEKNAFAMDFVVYERKIKSNI